MVIGAVPAGGGEVGGPTGYSYRALVVRAPRDTVLTRLAGLGFSGWVGPQEGDDVVAVPSGACTFVAAGGRDLEAVGTALAAGGSATLAAEVVRDRLLELLVWPPGAEQPLRYRSDPSVVDEELLDEPTGVEHTSAVAATFGAARRADALADELAEERDPTEHIESERLDRALRLLGLPSWPVSAWRLPRYVPGGPERSSLVRLRAGRTGWRGVLVGPPVAWGRRVRQTTTRRGSGPRRDVPDGGLPSTGTDIPPELW
ncbi:hypothetical protein [Aquipuribacter sp. SD81]|uniref:hypothetical protein n=1 Tax=Aquipuribacter sp. SD81 TaxID=3127703 RepID=UPI00301725CC